MLPIFETLKKKKQTTTSAAIASLRSNKGSAMID